MAKLTFDTAKIEYKDPATKPTGPDNRKTLFMNAAQGAGISSVLSFCAS